eukprot:jgi/Chlat1/158/Chrsp1S03099
MGRGGGGRGGGRGRGRGKRIFRRDFGPDARPNEWKKQRLDPNQQDASGAGPSGAAADGGRAGWKGGFSLNNEHFESYYKAQGVIPDDEWEAFMGTLRKPLPVTFRINGSGHFATHIRDRMKQNFFRQLGKGAAQVPAEDDDWEAPKSLPWYPEELAWQLNMSRMQLRKHPVLQRLHEFMKRANDAGSITRQEAVSMVPPFFLDVQPHHQILDMCAAPGSKTFQLLEMLHANDPVAVPEGMVIANDLDTQRCHLLVHQTKRMCTPSILVVNHEAQQLPAVDGALLFDRVLCDVPCSGDGTLRKAPDLWRKWNPGMANGLHRLQVAIAMRGIQLLKVGGRMVYSTCSLNPIEDEAVVAELLRRCKGSLQLLDVSKQMPELRRCPGLTSWKVRDKVRWYESISEVDTARSPIVASMFSDGPTPPASELALGRCMRILPHQQDTGGFFIAVFEKTAALPPERPPVRQQDRQKPSADASAPAAVEEAAAAAPAQEAAASAVPKPDDASVEAASAPATSAADAAATPMDVEAAAPATDANAGQQHHAEATAAGTAEGAAEESDARVTTDAVAREELPDTGKPSTSQPQSHAAGNGRGGGQRQKDGERRVQRQGRWKGVDPVIIVQDKELVQSMIDFYGFKPEFPLHTNLISRNEDVRGCKKMYYVSSSVLQVLKLPNINQLKIISTGLKVFERQETKDTSPGCTYRLAQEGLPVVLPFLTKQRVHATEGEFRRLLVSRSVAVSAFTDPETAADLKNVRSGCCVVVMRSPPAEEEELAAEEGEDTVPLPAAASGSLAVVCWRGKGSLTLLVSKPDAAVLLDGLPKPKGGQDSTTVSKSDVPMVAATAAPLASAPATVDATEPIAAAEAADSVAENPAAVDIAEPPIATDIVAS